ncbi:hypothetical protein DL96DRAFT_1560372 [Flagelloscypha sp. PMI_526]|nr:hypothetical protein DL96DRAFT_1560372 [Flagelloscypha sp. PMI_526]
MSLGPASIRLAVARSVIPFVPEVPGAFFELEDRSRKQDSLLDFLRFGNRNTEEVHARQVGGFDLGKLLAEQLKPTSVPREPADIEERSSGIGPLRNFRFGPFGKRDSEEVDARQIGSFDLATLLAEQLKPLPAPTSAHFPREASDLEERSRKSDNLLRILGLGRRDIEEVDARQLGSFNLPRLVSSSLAGRQIGSFDLSQLLAHQFSREAQPDSAERTLKPDRELTKELEEGIDRVARMIGRELEHTLD